MTEHHGKFDKLSTGITSGQKYEAFICVNNCPILDRTYYIRNWILQKVRSWIVLHPELDPAKSLGGRLYSERIGHAVSD
jgi:hypothetical protein